MSMQASLVVEQLACRRRQRMIFRNLDFKLTASQTLIVTGPNGCGKSSLLRILSGILPQHSGKITLNTDIGNRSERYRRYVHYIGHLDALKPELTVSETLSFWGVLYGIAALSHEDLTRTLETFNITRLRNTQVRHLSAGQKRRLTLSRLVLTPAPLWLLDEPTTALDHEGQSLLNNLLGDHASQGGITIISTHQDIGLDHCLSLDMKEFTR